MNKEIKPRKCKSRTCRALFTPSRKGLQITKYCCTACELDDSEASGNAVRKVNPKKPKTAAKLKKELWAIFSLHQKLVHSADGENCECYTCGKPLKIGDSDTHGGHCLSKAANPNLYFDERSVRVQCLRCNVHHGGMHYEFNEKLKQEIGLESWQEMYANRKLVVKKNTAWYLEKIEYYSNEVKMLKLLKSSATHP